MSDGASDAPELGLHERLEAVRVAAARDAHRSPAQARAILEARARRLARPAIAEDDAGDDVLDLLIMRVGDERLGIPLANIVAIARVGSIAPLPRAVAPVHGVTAWRGRPLTVLSLSGDRVVAGDHTRLVVLGSGSRATLAIVVDAVEDVESTRRTTLSAAGPGPRRSYALGVTPEGLLVVSGDALMDEDSRGT